MSGCTWPCCWRGTPWSLHLLPGLPAVAWHSQHSWGLPIATSTALAFHQVKGQFGASVEPAGSILAETREMITSWETSWPSLIKWKDVERFAQSHVHRCSIISIVGETSQHPFIPPCWAKSDRIAALSFQLQWKNCTRFSLALFSDMWWHPEIKTYLFNHHRTLSPTSFNTCLHDAQEQLSWQKIEKKMKRSRNKRRRKKHPPKN